MTNLALVSFVSLKIQLCLLGKGQTVHQMSLITNEKEMVTLSGRRALVEPSFSSYWIQITHAQSMINNYSEDRNKGRRLPQNYTPLL